MSLVAEKAVVILPALEYFSLFRPLCEYNKAEGETSLEFFKRQYWGHGGVLSKLIEMTVCWHWELELSKSSNAASDGAKRFKHKREDLFYEARCLVTSFLIGPSGSSGADRGPKCSSAYEVWLANFKKIMKKLGMTNYYIIADINYPPYVYLSLVPRESILYLYETTGDLKYTEEDGDYRKGFIKNTIARGVFYRLFHRVKDKRGICDPRNMDWGELINPCEMDEESIDLNVKYLNGIYSNLQLQSGLKKVSDKIEHHQDIVRMGSQFDIMNSWNHKD